MIKYIPVKNSDKVNWLDDRGVLVGFEDYQHLNIVSKIYTSLVLGT